MLNELAALGGMYVRVARGEKRPMGAGWQHRGTNDLEVVAGWLERGRSNVGLLLGPVSGLVDVEFDDDAGRDQLAAFGVLDIATPTWRSSRGEHRVFRWQPWMPAAAVVHAGELEVRIGGRAAQSVLPPSIHPDGSRYEWIVRPSDAPVASFPAQLLAGVVPCLA